MKYLGIDYGTKKVGIAISDDGGEFAFPKEIVAASDALERIAVLCATENIATVVIGESVAGNGEKNEVAEAANAFAKAFAAKTKLPVVFEREDFSSVEAHRFQTKAGNRDDSAAAIILQRFLDKRKRL
jgi:putative Holliday junction resolvase